MKKRILSILLISIFVLITTGCGNSSENATKPVKEPTNNAEVNDSTNEVAYSNCAKAGNTCSEQEILEGQKVKVKLNDTLSEDFYVIGDDGANLTLIMNDYIETPWISSEDIKGICASEKDGKSCGPYTALKNLNEKTKDWTNISDIKDYIYNVEVTDVEEHYNSLKITNGITTLISNSSKEYVIPGTTKARLMTTDEITNYKSADWLKKKVAEDFEAKKIKHFYVLTATPSYGGYDGTVKAVTCKYNSKFTNINVDSVLALMPVITVAKTSI